MANGLDATRLRAHWKEIDKIRQKVTGIEVLCGIECDILRRRGSISTMKCWPRPTGCSASCITRSTASRADHEAANDGDQESRTSIASAIRRAGCWKAGGADVAFDEILKAAADHGVMMEINAHPERLDLDDVHAAAGPRSGHSDRDQHRQP